MENHRTETREAANASGGRRTLGVIGGMGPEATLLFYRLILEHTEAENDQAHIDMIILNHASMPDRTRLLREGRGETLRDALIADARRLEACGADGFVVTCNTSHVFADELRRAVSIPFTDMVRETARVCASRYGAPAKIAVLATDGTMAAGIYKKELNEYGIEYYAPSPENQARIMRMIYEGVKGGKGVAPEEQAAVEREILAAGCDGAILACTELSVLRERLNLSDYYTDAMRVLVERAIRFAGAAYRAGGRS